MGLADGFREGGRGKLSVKEPRLCLSTLLCAFGQDAFDDAPAVVREIHQYLKKILDAKEETGANMLWNGRTVLRPISYGSKVVSDTEMKYGAPKREIFAVITFVEEVQSLLRECSI